MRSPSSSPPDPRRILPLLLSVLSACASPARPRVSLGPHALPNIGLAAAADWRIADGALGEWRLEAETAYQFLDDEDLASSGNEGAGDWTQAGLGARLVRSPASDASWELFAGLVRFVARGEVNVLEDAGTYWALRIGVGYHVRIGERLWLGPAFSTLVLDERQESYLVPQFCWMLRWQ